MGTEVGIFFMIVLGIVLLVLLLRVLLLGAGLFFGSVFGLPVFIKDLSKNWKKMSASDKISHISLIVIGIYIIIEILTRLCY